MSVLVQMVTLNGAIAWGSIKSWIPLAIGKAADIKKPIDFSSLTLSPCFDPISHLVYVADHELVIRFPNQKRREGKT
ncbi:hypothetical protein AAW31_06460 [Nitrosomonas communis]|nr:hypothetical protein AAW31_06460 [Nitrosomonas communis]